MASARTRVLESGRSERPRDNHQRACLPVATYSSMYATCNARSLMAFLSLRTKHPEAKFPSFPQREIEMVAEGMEMYFQLHMPLTWKAFVEHGRVCP